MPIADALSPILPSLPIDRPLVDVPSPARGSGSYGRITDGRPGRGEPPALPVDVPLYGELLRRPATQSRDGAVTAGRGIHSESPSDRLRPWGPPLARLANQRGIEIYQTLATTSDASHYPASFGVDVYV
jgi:hypothetical protein